MMIHLRVSYSKVRLWPHIPALLFAAALLSGCYTEHWLMFEPEQQRSDGFRLQVEAVLEDGRGYIDNISNLDSARWDFHWYVYFDDSLATIAALICDSVRISSPNLPTPLRCDISQKLGHRTVPLPGWKCGRIPYASLNCDNIEFTMVLRLVRSDGAPTKRLLYTWKGKLVKKTHLNST